MIKEQVAKGRRDERDSVCSVLPGKVGGAGVSRVRSSIHRAASGLVHQLRPAHRAVRVLQEKERWPTPEARHCQHRVYLVSTPSACLHERIRLMSADHTETVRLLS